MMRQFFVELELTKATWLRHVFLVILQFWPLFFCETVQISVLKCGHWKACRGGFYRCKNRPQRIATLLHCYTTEIWNQIYELICPYPNHSYYSYWKGICNTATQWAKYVKKTVHYFRLITRLKINGSDKKISANIYFSFLYNHPNIRGVHIMQKWQEFQKAPFKVKMENQMTKLSKGDI